MFVGDKKTNGKDSWWSGWFPSTKKDHRAILNEIAELKEIMALTQKELADGLKLVQTQVGKIAKEQSDRFDALTAKIKELEDIINAGGSVSQEVADAFTGVKAALQSLDDTIPDAPPTP